jgi:hypothetical protein
MNSNTERYGLAAGAVFAVLQLGVLVFITAGVLAHVPPPGAPAADRAAAFVEHAAALRLGNYLMLLPVPFLLWFAAAAAGLVYRRTAGVLLPLLVIAGAAAMAMLWPLGGAVSTIALLIAQGGGDAVVASALDAIAPFTLALSAVPRGVLLIALSLGMLRGPLGPAWVARTGIVVAALGFIGSAVLADDRLFPVLALSTLLWLLWMIAASLVLLRATHAEPAPTRVSATAGQGLDHVAAGRDR